MTRSSQTAPAAEPMLQEDQLDQTTGPAAVLVALLGLAGSMAAIAKFPNQPVPPSLVERLDVAQLALSQSVSALLEGGFALPSGAADDDFASRFQEISETFDSLNEALSKRFEEVAKAAEAQTKALDERLKALDAAIAAAQRTADEAKSVAGEAQTTASAAKSAAEAAAKAPKA